MTKLKPCPHCGEDQTLIIYVNHTTTSYIECSCRARVEIDNYDVMPGQMLDDLIARWNRRVGE